MLNSFTSKALFRSRDILQYSGEEGFTEILLVLAGASFQPMSFMNQIRTSNNTNQIPNPHRYFWQHNQNNMTKGITCSPVKNEAKIEFTNAISPKLTDRSASSVQHRTC